MPTEQISWSKTFAQMVYGVRNPKGLRHVVILFKSCALLGLTYVHISRWMHLNIFSFSTHSILSVFTEGSSPLSRSTFSALSSAGISLNNSSELDSHLRACVLAFSHSVGIFCTSLSLSYRLELNPCYHPYRRTLVLSPQPFEHFIDTSSHVLVQRTATETATN